MGGELRVINHSPAYAMEIHGRWRVVVPIRGKLTPRICDAEFPTRASAEVWLRSEEGVLTVDLVRSRISEARVLREGEACAEAKLTGLAAPP
jgi:hypothetical protein